MYVDDNLGQTPPNRMTNRWPNLMLAYYQDPRVLVCPADQPLPAPGRDPVTDPCPGDVPARSYIMNGWDDYYMANGSGIPKEVSVNEQVIHQPSETIVLGEKETASWDYYVDMVSLDDFYIVEQSRHRGGGRSVRGGASNYQFADGSARQLKSGQGLSPKNLWAISEQYRNAGIVLP
jgi:prepilin-type processing-associated H-X9-DG protein